ncbi:MAG: hypothetical protein CVU11_13750 [Bacteroidetes bacterium HGW-Bacteroidetes-6]|jgi:hypothetical protein|nr:MAG: hypothetical protein CVU11_13750 [Bacteroidetes bacterium HGW-Bacteroidetes-6]
MFVIGSGVEISIQSICIQVDMALIEIVDCIQSEVFRDVFKLRPVEKIFVTHFKEHHKEL